MGCRLLLVCVCVVCAQEDLDAIREGMNLPGAVYGRAGVRAAMQGREVPNPAAAAAAAAAAATAALEPH